MSPIPSISSMPSTPNSPNGSHHHQQHSKEVMPVQVALRVRPLNSRDRAQPRFSQNAESDVIKTFENTITIVPHQKTYTFDHVFDTKSTQEQIFETVGSRLVDRFLDGFNVTILAYGQTSSGKTYTMGTEIDDQIGPEHEGIIPRAMSTLFQRLELSSSLSSSEDQQLTHTGSSLQNGKRPVSTMMLSPPRLGRKGSAVFHNSSSSSSSRLRPVSMIQPPSNNNNIDGNTGRRGSAPTSTLHQEKTSRCTVKVSFVEIYNEELVDLLNPAPPSERPPVTVREDTKGHIYWTGIKEVTVESSDDVLRYLQMGTRNRATGSTDMNAKSSRSHAIFSVTLRQEKWVSAGRGSSSFSSSVKPTASTTTIVNGSKSRGTSPTPVSSRSSMITQPLNRRASALNVRAMVGQMERKAQVNEDDDGKWVVSHSKFHFVDLAGSERLKRTAAEGDRRKEGININAGLLALGNVISALAEPSKRSAHIPYRDSKLTRLLQDSLGGNATTLMIACVSPAEINLVETANTIKYAHRARNIKNKVERNEAEEWMTNDNPDYLRNIINKLKSELHSLKSNNNNNNNGSNGNCLSPATANGKNLSQYVPTISPSSSISETDRLQISTCASSSAKTTITVPDTNDMLENQALVADLRRQIEELQNELTVTRERNQHVEAELRRKNDNSKNSAPQDIDFQHLVEPVIEEYEKSISALESQLAMARAALTHSDQALADQEAKILEHESRRSIEQTALNELKARLAKAMEREQQSEAYIAELEGKLEKSVQEALQDQQVLTELKSKITKFKEMDENTEQYIADLESRLFTSESERDKLAKVAEQAQEQLREQGQQLENIKRRLSFNNQADDTFKLLLKDLELSQTRCQELEQELRRLRLNLAEEQQDAASAAAPPPPLSPMFLKRSETCASLQDEIGDKVEAELREQLQAKTDAIKALEKRLASTEAESRKEIESLSKQLQSKTSQMAALEQSIRDIETMRMEFQGLREEHSREIERLEQQLELAKSDYAACQAELLEQKRLNAEFSCSVSDLQTKLTSATTDKDKLESKLQAAQAQTNNLQKSLQEQEQGFQSRLQAGLQNLEQAHADIRALVAIQQGQQRIIQCLESKVASMDDLVSRLEETVAQRDQRITELENEKARSWQHLQMDMHHVRAEKKELAELLQFLEGSLRLQDTKSNELLCSIEALKIACEKQQRSSEDVQDVQAKLLALEQQLKQSQMDADIKLKKKKVEVEELKKSTQVQAEKIAELEKTLQVERLLVSQNDTSGVIAELQKQLSNALEQQKDYEAQLERARSEIEEAHRAKLDQQHVIESLESSLQAIQTRLEEAVASHAQKSLQIQSLQDQLANRRRLTIETNVNRDSGLPDEDRRWSDLVNRIAQLEKENQLLTSSQSCQDSTEDLERLCATPVEEDEEQLDPVEELQEQFRKKLNDPAGQEELLRKLAEYASEKSQLTAHVEKLEARLVLQRSQLTLENKNLELEILKLIAANERLEKEVEQALPRSTSMTNAYMHNNNRDSVSFSSPPQTPRVSAPPAPTGASTSLPYKPQREWSSSSFKLHKSGSLRSFLDKAEERAARRASGSSIRSSYTFSPARSRAQSTSCQSSSAGVSTPPPTAPPSNPLPPVPTALSSTTSSPPQSPSRSVSTPMLQRQGSATATTISDMLSSKGNFTSEQYEKIIRSLQRKAQVADNDVRAHQEVITKLEAQLSRSENAVRDVKRQLDTLTREKETYILEIQNLRSQINQVQSGQRLSMEQELQEREKLLKELEQERQLKDKAEKARRIMENRMEELMNKRHKFMCF